LGQRLAAKPVQSSAAGSAQQPDRSLRPILTRDRRNAVVNIIVITTTEFVIPPRLVVGQEAGERIMQRLTSAEPPNQAMQALFDESADAAPGDAA
jgi:hypothetical protein